jgi:hypothetical protein
VAFPSPGGVGPPVDYPRPAGGSPGLPTLINNALKTQGLGVNLHALFAPYRQIYNAMGQPANQAFNAVPANVRSQVGRGAVDSTMFGWNTLNPMLQYLFQPRG